MSIVSVFTHLNADRALIKTLHINKVASKIAYFMTANSVSIQLELTNVVTFRKQTKLKYTRKNTSGTFRNS